MQIELQIAFACRKRLRVKQEKPAHEVQASRVTKERELCCPLYK